MNALYIGIDDTDNPDTRGTGFQARQLAARLHDNNLAQTVGVTRHQLLVDDRVPYTSHNSSACLEIRTDRGREALMDFCRSFLLEIAAEGSDVGLCIADVEQAKNVTAFGRSAQTSLVSQEQAQDIAGQNNILLEGLTGDRQGIIGALSAVGLYADGNDGRYIWSRGLRELADRNMPLASLLEATNIDAVTTLEGGVLDDGRAMVELGPWPRAVRIDKKSVLLVEKLDGNQYKVLDKDIIKSVRP